MKSRMVKRILATLLAVVFLAGDVLPTVASDVEGSTQVIKEAEEEASSLWEEVTPAEGENKENESETPAATETPVPTEAPATTEPAESEGKTEASTEEAELTDIEGGETPLADGLDEEAEEEELDEEAKLKEGEEVAGEAGEDEYVILEHPAVDGVTVTVKAAAGVIPENTYVEVIELDPIEVEEIITTITELENEETAENEEVVVKRYKAFDITLYVDDEDGNKTVVEPADREKVTVSFAGNMIAPEGKEEVTIYHVDDNDTSNVEKMEEVSVTTDENDAQVVELVTDHFSKYVITYSDTGFLYTSGTGDVYFKVVDGSGRAIPNAAFYLYESDSNYSSKTNIPDELIYSDSEGNLHIDLTEYNTSKGTYYYVLKQVKTSAGLKKAADIHISEKIDTFWLFVDVKDTKITVDVNDGSNIKYEDYNSKTNKILIKNNTDTSSGSTVETDPGRLTSISKEATLEDWENRVYKLDLNAVVGRTISKPLPKVVVIGDASGSMTWVDVTPVKLDRKSVYFSNTCGDDASYSISTTAKTRILSYRKSNRKSGYVIPSSGSYYFYSEAQGAWFERGVSDSYGLSSDNCFTPKASDNPVDISAKTLYTDRGDAFITSLKTLVSNLPEGTKVELIKFNDDDTDVSNGFKTIGTNDAAIENAIASMAPSHNTATYPGSAFEKTLDSYYHWYEDNKDCKIVFFADGDSDGNADREKLFSTLLQGSGVEIYSVGLKTTGGVLSRVASEGDGHLFLCNQADQLVNAMKGISSDIAEKAKGRIVDEIDSHFEVCTPDGSVDSTTLSAYYDGASISENAITWNEAEITVGGTTTYEVYVKAKEDFAGGNVVPTNGTLTVSLNNVTKTATSPLVNVKGEVDANDQEDTIKRGETLEEYLEKHLAKVWNPEEQEAEVGEEGEEPKDPRFTTAKSSDYADVVIKFYEDEEHKKEITLENLKKATPEEDTTYYVVVEAVPKTTGANAQSQVGSAMTQDGTYYYMDRELEGHKREAVAEAKYDIIVKGYDLVLVPDKSATELSWTDRTYTITLSAESRYKVTKTIPGQGDIDKPARVVFLLDASSSMRDGSGKDNLTNSSLKALESQTKEFISGLDKGAEVAVVSFQNDASVLVPLTTISDSNREGIISKVSLPTGGSGTRSNEGLKIIESSILPATGSNYENTYIVYFTDGKNYKGSDGKYSSSNDHDNKAQANATLLKNRGVKIYCVGMGSYEKSFLNKIATDSAHVFEGKNASEMASNFKNIYEEVIEETETKTIPGAAKDIELYDVLTPYFEIADVEAVRAAGAEVGYTEGGLQYVKWTGLETTEEVNTVTRSFVVRAKDTFAGGNVVPTNNLYKVSAPDPNDPEKTIEKNFPESPKVDVNCVVTPGAETETIFLGESLADYWINGRDEAVKKAMINTGAYNDFSFFQSDRDVKWYRDEACTEEIADMTLEAPVKDTVYYGKVILQPTNEGKLKVEQTTVKGTYTITVLNGKITVTKTINVTDAEKKLKYDGQPIFTFNLKKDGQVVQTKVIYFEDFATGTKSVTFDKLGKGTYTVEELKTAGWELTSSDGDKSVLISSRNDTGNFSFTNKPVKQKAFADKDVVVNSITKNEDGTISFNKKKGSN